MAGSVGMKKMVPVTIQYLVTNGGGNNGIRLNKKPPERNQQSNKTRKLLKWKQTPAIQEECALVASTRFILTIYLPLISSSVLAPAPPTLLSSVVISKLVRQSRNLILAWELRYGLAMVGWIGYVLLSSQSLDFPCVGELVISWSKVGWTNLFVVKERARGRFIFIWLVLSELLNFWLTTKMMAILISYWNECNFSQCINVWERFVAEWPQFFEDRLFISLEKGEKNWNSIVLFQTGNWFQNKNEIILQLFPKSLQSCLTFS